MDAATSRRKEGRVRQQPEAALETLWANALSSDPTVLWVKRQVRLMGGAMRVDLIACAGDEDTRSYQVIEFKARPANRHAFDQALLYAIAFGLENNLDQSKIRSAVVAPGITRRSLLTDFPAVEYIDASEFMV